MKTTKKKKVIILGSNGYIGNALMTYLEKQGMEVAGCDNNWRNQLVKEIGGNSLIPVKRRPKTRKIDVCHYKELRDFIAEIKPTAIVHLAEQPSAPYSHIGPRQAYNTQFNNVCGSLNVLWAIKEVDPTIHLIKLGTAGEYPDWLYKNIQIPEGARIKVQYQEKDWEIPTPRYFGSFYHASKFFGSYNIDYACKIWGLNATDINQAPVYGHRYGTRFDYDYWFGTVVNRFAVQAVAGYPLTVYGVGGQTRGFIHIDNSMDAIKLVIQNPPKGFRVIHQLTEVQTIMNIAKMFQELTNCKIKCIENPRAEMPNNTFDFEMRALKEMGLIPIYMKDSLERLIWTVQKYKHKINKSVIMGDTKWK